MPRPVFYRFFKNRSNDVVELPEPKGTFRLASSLFKSQELSVDDGELCEAEDTHARNQPCGVASVDKSVVTQLGLTVRPDAEPGNPAHTLIVNTVKAASKLSRSSRVVIPLPDLRMINVDGTPIADAAVKQAR